MHRTDVSVRPTKPKTVGRRLWSMSLIILAILSHRLMRLSEGTLWVGAEPKPTFFSSTQKKMPRQNARAFDCCSGGLDTRTKEHQPSKVL